MMLEVGVAVDMSLPPLRKGDPYPLLINRLVVGIDQLDEDRVRPWREAIDDDGIAAGVCPVPCGVVDRHVNVSNLWSHGERRRSEYRHDVQVLGAILNNQQPTRQGFGDGRIDNDLRRWFVWERPGSTDPTCLPCGSCRACR